MTNERKRQLLQPGDSVLVTAAASPVATDAKLSPFSDIRWNNEEAEILVNGTWYKWLGTDRLSLKMLIDSARDMDHDWWQKRIDEDLVQVLMHSHQSVGTDVTLLVQDLDSGKTEVLNRVPITEENRRSVHLHRQERKEP